MTFREFSFEEWGEARCVCPLTIEFEKTLTIIDRESSRTVTSCYLLWLSFPSLFGFQDKKVKPVKSKAIRMCEQKLEV